MRLEFEPNVTAFPLIENELFDDVNGFELTDVAELLKKGISAAQNGERELARNLLFRATEIDSRSEDAWMWLASISEYPEELLAFLNNVLEINPENERAGEWRVATRSLLAKTFVGRGIGAHEEGADEFALQCFDQALVYDEECELAWFWKASIVESADERAQCLERVLSINPENEDARKALDSIRTARSRAAISNAKAVAVASETPKPSDLESESEPIERGRRANVIFETIDVIADANRETAESIHSLLADAHPEDFAVTDAATNEESADVVYAIKGSDEDIHERITSENIHQFDFAYSSVEPGAVVQAVGFACPYCSGENESQAFECNSCHATLTLSDIETLLSNSRADRDLIQQSVTEMEAAWNLREFSEQELTALSIGHFNLGNYERGFKYLQEASRLDPNNVILSGHLNTIAIRLEEMRRQDEVHEARPVGKTILVVDDSPTVRKLIAGKLEKSGHHVICSANGIDGLTRIEESLPDLILLDIAMPGMDGYQVCKQIRLIPAAKNLPIVMISGKDGFFDKVRGRLAGTTGYITKPFGPETLMKALETYLVYETDPGQ